MRDFFSLDGPFQKYGGFLADMMILSLMWILFSLPLVTIGASTTALFYVSTRRIADREGYITSDFWEAFKLNFFKSTILWLALGAVLMLLVMNIIMAEQFEDWGSFVVPVQIIMLAQLVFIFIYMFPITARFEMKNLEIVKTSFFMANRHLLTTLCCGALLMAMLFAIVIMPLMVFLAPGFYAIMSSYMLVKVFKRYRPDMDRDPRLEILEIESKKEEAKKMKTFELTNKNGLSVLLTNVGCAIMKILVPTEKGPVDIVHGFETPDEYMDKHPFFGVVCGRVANRIAGGKFMFEGKEVSLERNDGNHHLHGGSNGFDKKIWNVLQSSNSSVVFSLNSPDGDSGYPGDLSCKVEYILSDENVLRINYHSTTRTKTVCNLTNHSYFNLCGHDAKNIYGQELEICSDKLTAVDEGLIPTGEFSNVERTPFDFRAPKAIGQDIEAAGKVNNTGGYDHNYVLRGEGKAASAYSPHTKIRMSVYTDSPGIQLYTGNFLDGTVKGKGVTYNKHSAFCLETQFFPNSANIPSFPSMEVTSDKPQALYTEFKFEW